MLKIKLTFLISILILLNSHANKKVLIIGIDGCRPDCLEAAQTPNMDALIKNGAYTNTAFAGGVQGKSSEQKTSSGPGWTSILTGVWIDVHGVKDNSFWGYKKDKAPHLFKRIKEQNDKLYSSSSWEHLQVIKVPLVATSIPTFVTLLTG